MANLFCCLSIKCRYLSKTSTAISSQGRTRVSAASEKHILKYNLLQKKLKNEPKQDKVTIF